LRTSKLVADVEGNFPELTLEVGRRLQLDEVVVVEWTCNYGDGRLYRNVTIGELEDGQAVRTPTTGASPSSHPNGASRSPIDSTCPATASGRTESTLATTRPPTASALCRAWG
jgi:hypothetical protein